jgi:hypothetical protein
MNQTPDRDLRGAPDKRLVTLDEICRSSLKEFSVPGCSVAVVLDQKIVYAKGFGAFSDPLNKDDATSAWMSSVSKKKEVPVEPDTVLSVGTGNTPLLGLALGSVMDEKRIPVGLFIYFLSTMYIYDSAC